MPLWGSVDNAANSSIAAVAQIYKSITTANQTALYDNVTVGAFVTNVAIGQFGVDTTEIRAMQSMPHPQHAGWVLRKEGTGGRAGRVQFETLVAMGSMNGDGSDDTWIPDYYLSISSQPSNANGAGNVTLTVAATSTPSGASLSYLWQRNPGTGWVDVANTAGLYFNNTSPTLTVNAAIATGNVFRADVIATGANTIYSSNASVTTP